MTLTLLLASFFPQGSCTTGKSFNIRSHHSANIQANQFAINFISQLGLKNNCKKQWKLLCFKRVLELGAFPILFKYIYIYFPCFPHRPPPPRKPRCLPSSALLKRGSSGRSGWPPEGASRRQRSCSETENLNMSVLKKILGISSPVSLHLHDDFHLVAALHHLPVEVEAVALIKTN